MTKEEFLEKIEELFPSLNEYILKKAKEVINSGAIDFEKYENNYALPKIFMCAMGKEIEFQYKPFTKEYQKEVKNLSYFL